MGLGSSPGAAAVNAGRVGDRLQHQAVGGGDVAGPGPVGRGQDVDRARRVPAPLADQQQAADDPPDHLPAEGVGDQPDPDQPADPPDPDRPQPPGRGGPGPAAAEGGEVVLPDQGGGGLADPLQVG